MRDICDKDDVAKLAEESNDKFQSCAAVIVSTDTYGTLLYPGICTDPTKLREMGISAPDGWFMSVCCKSCELALTSPAPAPASTTPGPVSTTPAPVPTEPPTGPSCDTWSVNSPDFMNSMTANFLIRLDGNDLNVGTLGAFIQENIQGVTPVHTDEIPFGPFAGSYMHMAMIYGHSGQDNMPIQYKLCYNGKTYEKHTFTAASTGDAHMFVTNGVFGSVVDPIIMDYSSDVGGGHQHK